MQKIKILSENLSNMIAAGEVVERPVSIVKELVENAIDAGSSKIEISLREGGKRYIRIADNGRGMGRDDALLCLERHATSKIESPEDLFNITTMGFRGEALASISSVSKMVISTKEKEAIEGTSIIIEGGTVKDVTAAGIPSGTIIEVKNLFFNTPARRKFLKTTVTEMGHISDFVARTALAFPSIGFSLRSEKATHFELPRGAVLEERIAALIGKEGAGNLIEINEESAELRLSGFISPPSMQRSSASGLYIYVNGRFVRDKVIRHALLQGYGNYIMRGKYPLAVIFLEIDPANVDVNVHPAKSEVRFRESGAVHSFVSSTIDKALGRRQWLPASGESDSGFSGEERRENIKRAAAEYVSQNETLQLKGGYVAREEFHRRRGNPVIAGHGEKFPGALYEEELPSGEAVLAKEEKSSYFSSLAVIGQVGEMYIVCEGEKGMILIDQHAACERIAFEELKRGYDKKNYKIQQLLIPETIDLTPREASALENNRNQVARLGFHIENFGGRSFVVKAIPSILGSKSVKEIVTDMASELSELPKSKCFEAALEDIIKRIACHSVVRGKRRMTHEEMRALLKSMDESGIVPHCPHGRPAHIDFTLPEIEKRFERT
ncbi:MAG: DNA mismatch repair endonuclease MutL [Deltaproteobacteria bacterium]|nr:DNA mismatch repair endonuclease MutL [Deltaproteobacteria bacterium]